MWKNTIINFNLCFKQYLHKKNELSRQVIQCVRYKTSDGTTIRPGSQIIAKRPPVKYVFPKGEDKPHKQQRKITVGDLFLLAVPITTFCLGIWQVKRREMKLKLISNLESKMNEDPIQLPDDLDELSNLEYRRVKARGKFDHSNEVYLGPRALVIKGDFASKSGLISAGSSKYSAGHYVVTPFELAGSGKRILINRGWVPTASLLPAKRPEGQIEDEVEIVGVVRLHEQRGKFVPDNKPHLRVYHFRDLEKMGLKTNSLPYFMDATDETTVPGGPIGGQTNVTVRNEHMSYIITWFSLSAITGVLWFKKVFK